MPQNRKSFGRWENSRVRLTTLSDMRRVVIKAPSCWKALPFIRVIAKFFGFFHRL